MNYDLKHILKAEGFNRYSEYPIDNYLTSHRADYIVYYTKHHLKIQLHYKRNVEKTNSYDFVGIFFYAIGNWGDDEVLLRSVTPTNIKGRINPKWNINRIFYNIAEGMGVLEGYYRHLYSGKWGVWEIDTIEEIIEVLIENEDDDQIEYKEFMRNLDDESKMLLIHEFTMDSSDMSYDSCVDFVSDKIISWYNQTKEVNDDHI